MKNEQFEKDIELVPNVFKKLCIVNEDGENILRGELDVIDGTGKLWETYHIELKGSKHYPMRFPKLFETYHAFPKILDWHVYEEDGSCCVDVTPSELLLCKDGLHVTDYLQQFAIPYFANQKFRELEGYYLYGEYSHGIFGRIEFYQRKLKARNPQDLLKMFQLIIRGFHPSRTSQCPFCHETKFRKCHRDAFKQLEGIKGFLDYDLPTLTRVFVLDPNYELPKV